MSTTLMSFRPDSHLASRLERLTILTGRSKTYYLKEALRVSLDAFEKEAFEQAKSRKEMKMNKMDNYEEASMTQRLAWFETAQEVCGLMGVIRRDWIRSEKRKEFPDQDKIRQWKEEAFNYEIEREDLRFDDIQEQERIFREYSPQVKAEFRKAQEPVYAAA